MTPTSTTVAPAGRSRKGPAALIAAVVISVVCLAFALSHFEPEKFWEEVRGMDWNWVLLAAVTDILVYVIQGLRWSLLLQPVQPVSFNQCVRAIYVGLFANEVLPFRTGEVIRCFLLTRWTRLPFAVSLSSALVERLFDGVWLMLLLALSLQFVPLDSKIVSMAWFVGGLILVGVVVVGVAMFWRHGTPPKDGTLLQKLHLLRESLYAMGHSRLLYYAFFVSLPHLLMQIAPIYALIRAYGLDLSLGAAGVIMVVLRLGSVIPGLPGNLGTFQVSAMLALGIFGVDAAMATRFSFVMWGAITMPLLLAGFVALLMTGMRLGELRREAQANLHTK